MIKNIHIILTTLIAILATATTFAQDCKQEVRELYTKLGATPPPGNNAVYYFSFEVKTMARNAPQNTGAAASTVELIVSEKQTHYISDQVMVYDDRETSFTIIPSRKAIYWSDSNTKAARNDKSKELTFLQDTLFDMSTVTECKTVKGKEGYNKIVVLSPSAEAKKLFMIEKVTIYMDTNTKTLKKTRIDYTAAHQLENIEVTYLKTDLNYKSKDINTPLKSRFIDSTGKLTGKYKDYKLMDSRKKK